MAQGPSLQGQIVINTRSVDQAITSVRKLEQNTKKAFGLGGKAASDFANTLDQQSGAYKRAAQENKRYQNIIAKAANTVANYEAAVQKSNIADGKKSELVKQAAASLKGFEQAVRAGATGGQQLTNVTTELNVSLGQMKRDLGEATKAQQTSAKATRDIEKAQIRNGKILSSAQQQYDRLASAIRTSTMSEADKIVRLRELDAAQNKLNATLNNTNSTVRQVSQAQNKYKEAINGVNIATKKSRMGAAAAETNKYATEMRNLSTSVVVALGPLSGVASRITALTTLFNRNAASIAAVLAAMTGFSVLFAQSAKVSQEAEKQMFRVNAQLEILGDSAQVTGAEINAMAHSIAGATLLSAKEVRDAAGALIEFGGIGRSQLADVTKAAQGMSVVFGGNLQGNIRKFGRAIDEPVEGLQRLERFGVILTDSVKEQIKALSQQGKKMEATNVLLRETAGLQAAAEAEAKGLAGAYDTVSGNLDILFESLFLVSGAAEEMRGSVLGVAEAVSEFAKSDEAAAIGEAFRGVASTMGTAFKFLINNIEFLGGAVIFIAGSAIPKLLTALVLLSGRGLFGASKAATTAAASLTSYSAATGRATTATKAFNFTLKANPVIALTAGVTALVVAIGAYDDAVEAATSSGKAMSNQLSAGIKQAIINNENLTKKEAERFQEQGKGLADKLSEENRVHKEIVANEERLQAKLAETRTFAKTRVGSQMKRSFDEQRQSLDGLIEMSGRLQGEEKQVVDELIRATQARQAQEQAVANVEAKMKDLVAIVEKFESGGETTPIAERMEALNQTTQDLSSTYQKSGQKVKTLKADLEAAQDAAQEYLDVMSDPNAGQAAIEASKALGETKILIEAIKVALAEASKVEVSKEFVKLEGAIRKAKDEADFLKATVNMSDEGKAITQLAVDIDRMRDSTKELVSNLSGDELSDLTNNLPGVTEASGIDAITEAYLELLATRKLEVESLKQEASARQLLQSHADSQLSSMESLQVKYEELVAAAAKTPEDDGGGLAEWLQAEQDKINSQAEKIASTPFTGSAEQIQAQFDARKEQLAELYADDKQKFADHIAEMEEKSESAKMFSKIASGAQAASTIVEGAMDAMSAAGKENSQKFKNMAIAQAVINAALAVTEVLKDPNIPSTSGKVLASIGIAASAATQIAKIRSTNMATGGLVKGPGTGTSDSIPANLSNGEYVLQAEAVRKIGLANLERMNRDGIAGFSGGGSVSPLPVSSGSFGGEGSSVNLTIIDNSSGDKSYRTEETTNDNGEKELRLFIESNVKRGIQGGKFDRDLGSAFGLKRQGRKV